MVAIQWKHHSSSLLHVVDQLEGARLHQVVEVSGVVGEAGPAFLALLLEVPQAKAEIELVALVYSDQLIEIL
jgi:hypothetical protein